MDNNTGNYGEEYKQDLTPVPSQDKTLAAIMWIFPIIGIIMMFLPDTKKKAFLYHHARQTLGWFVFMFALGIIYNIFNFILMMFKDLGSIVGCFTSIGFMLLFGACFIFQIITAISAYKGEMKKAPVIGDMVEQFVK